jgi:hypothetical protein
MCTLYIVRNMFIVYLKLRQDIVFLDFNLLVKLKEDIII